MKQYFVRSLYLQTAYDGQRDPFPFKYDILQAINDYESDFNENVGRKVYATFSDPAQALDCYLDCRVYSGCSIVCGMRVYRGYELVSYDDENGEKLIAYDFSDNGRALTLDIAKTVFTGLDDGRVLVETQDIITDDMTVKVCKTESSAKAQATRAELNVSCKYSLVLGRGDLRTVTHRDYRNIRYTSICMKKA